MTTGRWNERLTRAPAERAICGPSGGRSDAAACGESRAYQFAAGHGGISADRFPRGGEAGGAAAIAEALLAPDSGMARRWSRARRPVCRAFGSRPGWIVNKKKKGRLVRAARRIRTGRN